MTNELRKTQMNFSKTQYYGGDGTGRDTYIYMSNGGFCPEKQPVKIEDLGSFVVTKARPAEPLAHIHSKPVNYTNNGGGRDTYISDSAGGLKMIYQPAYQKRTFYNNLRQYPPLDWHAKRGKSHTASYNERTDIFSQSQDHFTRGFRREMRLVSNYQRMLDSRLAQPKAIKKVGDGYMQKVYKNSSYADQKMHQSIFSDPAKNKELALDDNQKEALRNFDNTVVSHLNNSFSQNFKQYDQLEKPQKLALVKQIK